MARTESKSIQVHPADEQSQIDLMQKFHWNLLSTQEIKNIDNHLERRGDTIYQVTKSEHYVKLAFTRDLDNPNLNKIKELEKEYFSLPYPAYPGTLIWLWVILSLFWGIGVIAGIIYFLTIYKNKKQEAEQVHKNLLSRRQEILNEVEQLG